MEKINITTYKVNNKAPFKTTQLWSVLEPTIEFDSPTHGDLALVFKPDGSIEITYWSPNVSVDATDVVPTNLVLKP